MKSWEAGSIKEKKKEKTKWYLFEFISVALPRARTTDFHILIYLILLESNSTTRLTMRIMVVKMCMGWICLFFEPVQGSLAQFIVHHLKSPSINITRIDRIINQEQNWVLSGLIGFAARAVQPVMVQTINNSAGGHIIFQSAGSQDQQIYVEPTRVRLRKAILMALAMSICIAIIYWVFLTSAPTGRAFEGVTKWAENLAFVCRIRYWYGIRAARYMPRRYFL
jgi:hypothetical protein